jgi:hypothetical protein
MVVYNTEQIGFYKSPSLPSGIEVPANTQFLWGSNNCYIEGIGEVTQEELAHFMDKIAYSTVTDPNQVSEGIVRFVENIHRKARVGANRKAIQAVMKDTNDFRDKVAMETLKILVTTYATEGNVKTLTKAAFDYANEMVKLRSQGYNPTFTYEED